MNQFFRIQIDAQVLEEAVNRAISYFVKNNRSFTAYELTEILRNDIGQNHSVDHNTVKNIVHQTMSYLVNSGLYNCDTYWTVPNSGGQTAIRYSPSDVWLDSTANVVPTLPVAALPAPVAALTAGNQQVKIPNIRVNSTCVSGIAYDGDVNQGEMTVKMNSGGSYVYKNVPLSVYQSFINAQSKGKFYSQSVKGKYHWSEVS